MIALVRVKLVAIFIDIALVASRVYLRFILVVSRVVERYYYGSIDCSIIIFLVVNMNPRTLA
jgi:hypothetical protein